MNRTQPVTHFHTSSSNQPRVRHQSPRNQLLLQPKTEAFRAKPKKTLKLVQTEHQNKKLRTSFSSSLLHLQQKWLLLLCLDPFSIEITKISRLRWASVHRGAGAKTETARRRPSDAWPSSRNSVPGSTSSGDASSCFYAGISMASIEDQIPCLLLCSINVWLLRLIIKM